MKDRVQPKPKHRLGIVGENPRDQQLVVDTDVDLAADLRRLPYMMQVEDLLDGRYVLTLSPRYDYQECVAAIREMGDGL